MDDAKIQIMEQPTTSPAPLSNLVEQLVTSYLSDPATSHLDSPFLPNRARTIELIELLRRLTFPGFFDTQRLSSQTVHLHIEKLLGQAHDLMYEQVREAIRHENDRLPDSDHRLDGPQCDERAGRTTLALLQRLPALRKMLGLDIRAAFDGDPAACGMDETIFCYPGVDAIFVHRLAHELWGSKSHYCHGSWPSTSTTRRGSTSTPARRSDSRSS